MNLRDALLDALNALPGSRIFHLHLLVSAPRRSAAVFPYASVRHRLWAQDVLVLLSEQPGLVASGPNSPRVLVTAVEAVVYTIPSTASAILYISKVDSTGQGAAPSPTTSLVRALISFYADPTTRPVRAAHLWVHLFARAQNQYLFPNSSEHPGKRVLTDVKLCAWWKRIYTDVARAVEARVHKAVLHFVLPGYDELEARQALGELSTSETHPRWTYGHPYTQTEIPLPYLTRSSATILHNLGHFIPSFDDDPKSRFVDEIACTHDGDMVKSPPRKRARTGESSTVEAKKEKDAEEKPHGELGKVTVDDFWERMSFRQECVSGAVTGFFVAAFSSPLPSSAASPVHPTAQPGQVSHQMNKRLISSLMTGHEFSTTERARRATQVLEAAIKGLCEGLSISSSSGQADHDENARKTPERELAPALPQTPPRRGHAEMPDITPNPFPEPEPATSLETYHSFIYGSVVVCNVAGGGGHEGPNGNGQGNADTTSAPAVTVLAARKKVKKKV